MQRKAIKQLNKVTQWTNEKVFSGEKTNFSAEFTDFEQEIEPRRIGIERLHATSLSYHAQLTKVKPSADPFPPGGASKDKISVSEALGLVMISYGDEIGGALGDALTQYGRTRCKLAIVQDEFANRLGDGYFASMEAALASVNEYKAMRKKLDSRRLTLDSAITRLKGSKKDSASLEADVDVAQQRFEEAEEETRLRMVDIQEQEQGQFDALADFLDAELDYFAKSKEILEELRDSFPRSVNAPSSNNGNRPRTKSNASARSSAASRSRAGSAAGAGGGGGLISRSFTRNVVDSDDESPSGNRSRSGSNASAGKPKEKRSILPSFGSFGKKTGSNLSGGGLSSPRFRKNKYGSLSDDERRGALDRSEADDDDDDINDEVVSRSPPRPSYSDRHVGGGRARSQSSVTTYASVETPIPAALASPQRAVAPPLRRSITSPATSVHYVKAIYDFSGDANDELSFVAGQIIEVKSEVSDDWWIGECEGSSGLFPRAYTVEHVSSPVSMNGAGSGRGVPPPLPGTQRPRTLPPVAGATVGGGARRTLPPPIEGRGMASPAMNGGSSLRYTASSSVTNEIRLDTDSEVDSYNGYSDTEQVVPSTPTATSYSIPSSSSLSNNNNTASSTAAQLANRSRASSIKKPAPPPPPPSRRSASSNNIETVPSVYLSLPNPTNSLGGAGGRGRSSTLSRGGSTTLESSPEVSPFGGSDEEAEVYGKGSNDPSNGGLDGGNVQQPPALPRMLSSGLGDIHLSSGAGSGGKASVGICTCGCADFTQNVFKPKGTCSSCFHQHPAQ